MSCDSTKSVTALSRRVLRLSIFHKQAICMSLVVVMTAGVVGFACYQFARGQLRNQIHRRLATIALDRALLLNTYVAQQHERVGLVASRTKLRELLNQHRQDPGQPANFFAETSSILRDATAFTDGFLAVRVTDENGMVITATDDALVGDDVADWPEFKRGRHVRTIGEPRRVNGAYVAYLAGPAVSNDDEFLGVVIVTLDAMPLYHLLHDLSGSQPSSSEDARAGVEGDVETSIRVLVGTRDGEHVRYLFAPDSDRESPPTRLEEAEAMRLAIAGRSPGFGTLRHDGVEVLAAWQPVSYHLPEYRAWGLVVKVDADEAYAPVSQLGQILLLVLIVLLPFAVVFAYLIARQTSQPLLQLAEAAREVAQGNLDRRVSVESSDEIGTLGAAFNTMNQELDGLYRLLERRVQERTEELARSNRELEQFAYVASHDLQEPLRTIQSFGDLLEKHHSGQLDEQGLDFLHRMQKAAQRMRTLIKDLLAFARVSTSGQPFVAVNLNDIANGVVGDLATQIADSSASVQLDELPTIDADRTQMRQLFQNLIVNALKYCREDTPPRVRVTDTSLGKGDCCRIEVEDNGMGIPEEESDRIFQPFQRLHRGRALEGTGIGLALCRRIVERHGGRITLHSTVGVGSTFEITLPRKQAEDRDAA